MGHGIFTSDGAKWEEARALVRPNFVRNQVADLEAFEGHFQNMISLIPTDGKTPVELKPLFQRMVQSAPLHSFRPMLTTAPRRPWTRPARCSSASPSTP